MRLSTLRIGDGPRAVVLLHGFLGSGRNLLTLARRWSAADPSRTFLLPDLAGHGASPPLPPNATLATLADDVLETARIEGVPASFDVVGHSMGGRVALHLRAHADAPVRRLTLLDISPDVLGDAQGDGQRTADALVTAPATPATREAARDHLTSTGLAPGIVEWLLTNLVPKDGGYVWRIDREALARFRTEVTNGDLWPLVGHPAGLQLVRGGRSPYVSPRKVERLQAAGVPVVTIGQAGHFVHVDAPGPLLDALRAFHD